MGTIRTGALAAAAILLVAGRADAQAGGTADRTEQRIAQLHSELQITASEEQSWDAFAAVMRQNASDIGARMKQRTADYPKMNAVDDLKSYADVSALHAEAAQRLVQPFQTLYVQLSPTQKSRADAIFHQAGPHHGPLHG